MNSEKIDTKLGRVLISGLRLSDVEVRDSRGGLKRLDLGNYHKIEQAKQACERHFAAGCDLGSAEKISRS
jgi:hypothetical protein